MWRVVARGIVEESVRTRDVEVRDVPVQELPVTLDCGDPIPVLVVDDRDRPIEGASVDCRYELPDRGGSFNVAPTDAGGRTEITCVPVGITTQLVASKPGLGFSSPVDYAVTEANELAILTFRKRPTQTVSGRVVFPDSSPAVGVRIFAGSSGPRYTEGKTDDEGRFRLVVPLATFPVEAHAGIEGGSTTGPIVVSEAAPIEDLELVLGAENVIRVRVVGADGNPLERAWIEAAREQRPRFAYTGQTDEHGWDALPLEPGTYVLSARQGDLIQYDVVRGITPGGAPVELRLEEPEARTISGVVYHEGRPVAGARVVYYRESSDWLSVGANAWTDESGRFTLKGVRGDRVFVGAWGEGFAFARSGLLLVPHRGGVDGVVVQSLAGPPCTFRVEAANGDPLRGSQSVLRGTLSGADAFAWEGRTDDGGLLRLPQLPYGEYQLRVDQKRTSPQPLKWGRDAPQPLRVVVPAE